MRLLVLGGTGFVGRHIVEGALARGDEVTLFNRGRSAPALFAGVELLRGDRAGDLSALAAGGTWDAAIDVTGYRPKEVEASSRLLAGRVERLTFISTVSVYADVSRPGTDEDAPLAELTGAGRGADYGALKALCEQAVDTALPGRALVVRPGSSRVRTTRRTASAGGSPAARAVAACSLRARRGAPLQLIDARDLAAFVLEMTAAQETGTYNAVSADRTWEEMIAACCGLSPDGVAVWVSDARLLAAGIDEAQLPLWIAGSDAQNAGFMRISGERAAGAGLRHRPIAQTARDTHAALRPEDGPGLEPALEARLIAA